MMLTLGELTARFSATGRLDWIGTRPGRNIVMLGHEQIEIEEKGLIGDRTSSPGKRSVTLIQAEHLPVIASLANLERIDPQSLRRNLVVSSINLLALKDKQFQIGNVILEGTGICAPCSKMERTLGYGAYNAMRGHGGITALVVRIGNIRLGDRIEPLP